MCLDSSLRMCPRAETPFTWAVFVRPTKPMPSVLETRPPLSNDHRTPSSAVSVVEVIARWEYWDEETGRHGQGSGTTPMKGGAGFCHVGGRGGAQAEGVWFQ